MTIACPACRAENTERTCRRCRADLGLLRDLEDRRERLMFDAAEALRRGECERAIKLAQAARGMRDGADADRVAACAFLLRGETSHDLRRGCSYGSSPGCLSHAQ